MRNIPNQIYLQVGSECPDDADFNGLSEVTWCKDKINVNDIAYIRREKAIKAFKEAVDGSYIIGGVDYSNTLLLKFEQLLNQ